MLSVVTVVIVLSSLLFWDNVFSALPERLREWFLALALLVFFVASVFNLPEPAESSASVLVGFYSGLGGMHYYTKRKNGPQC